MFQKKKDLLVAGPLVGQDKPMGVDHGNGRPSRRELTPQMVLARAVTTTVRVSDIDFDDTLYVTRHSGDGTPDVEFDIEDGVVTFSTAVDPVVMQRLNGSNSHRIVAGWTRLTALRSNASVSEVKCAVLVDPADEEAQVYASRANLGHGRILTTAERRTCFKRELAAIEAGGFACPNVSALARAYGVSRNTIKTWKHGEQPEQKPAASANVASAQSLDAESLADQPASKQAEASPANQESASLTPLPANCEPDIDAQPAALTAAPKSLTPTPSVTVPTPSMSDERVLAECEAAVQIVVDQFTDQPIPDDAVTRIRAMHDQLDVLLQSAMRRAEVAA